MTQNIAIYPGSFDPITFGHIDIVKRASKIFDKVILAIARDNTKNSLFSMDQKVKMAQNELKDLKNLKLLIFNDFFFHKIHGNLKHKSLQENIYYTVKI